MNPRGQQSVSTYTPRPQVYPDFLSRQAPLNYIAGLGRGAAGFTTRSDIGPAREMSAEESEVPENGDAMQDGKETEAQQPKDDERFQDPDNETGLFASLPYGADDEEADRIYAQVEEKMDERRKARREQRERQEREKARKDQPKIQEQFADLKRGLSAVTEEEWSSIPEVGDLVRRKGKKNSKVAERFTPVTDTLLLAGRESLSVSNTIESSGTEPSFDGKITDFRQFGQAKDKILSFKLDQASDSHGGATNIDPKGYLTEMSSINLKSDAEISDIRKARTLLRSVTATNPKHAPGWIAAARLEEVAGKSVAARNLIALGCDECPKNEDIWLEAARLNNSENSKIILANAVRENPQSVKIWLRAVELETDSKLQKKVLRRALEFIPNSVTIWKSLISLENDPEDAKILLSRAVECVPLSVELWLALARLENYQNAKIVLNKARVAIPISHEIWIAACKLEEAHGNEKMVETIMSRAVSILEQKGCTIDREQWIAEAEQCESENAPLTCQAIISSTIGIGLEEEDMKSTWIADAEACTKKGHITTARAIYAYALKVFPHKKGIWRQAAFFTKLHGTPQALDDLLALAVKACPKAEVLWLISTKEKWLSGDVSGAREIMVNAFSSLPNSEQIWLAAIKLEVETGEFERGRALLKSAREKANTKKIWMKSALLERQLGNHTDALSILEQAIAQYPAFDKLWMMKGQIEDSDLGDTSKARETYAKAVKQCPKSIPLWILAARLEEKLNLTVKARALLEKGRLLNIKSDVLWLEAVRVETRSQNQPMAKALLSKALQECSMSGKLWSEAILMEARPQRKARSADALKKCENSPFVLITVARLFWAERKLEKAKNWFKRATKLDGDLGDAWAWLLNFEMQHGNEASVKEVIDECVSADPKHGEMWQAVRKDLKNIGRSTNDILKLVAAQCTNAI